MRRARLLQRGVRFTSRDFDPKNMRARHLPKCAFNSAPVNFKRSNHLYPGRWRWRGNPARSRPAIVAIRHRMPGGITSSAARRNNPALVYPPRTARASPARRFSEARRLILQNVVHQFRHRPVVAASSTSALLPLADTQGYVRLNIFPDRRSSTGSSSPPRAKRKASLIWSCRKFLAQLFGWWSPPSRPPALIMSSGSPCRAASSFGAWPPPPPRARSSRCSINSAGSTLWSNSSVGRRVRRWPPGRSGRRRCRSSLQQRHRNRSDSIRGRALLPSRGNAAGLCRAGGTDAVAVQLTGTSSGLVRSKCWSMMTHPARCPARRYSCCGPGGSSARLIGCISRDSDGLLPSGLFTSPVTTCFSAAVHPARSNPQPCVLLITGTVPRSSIGTIWDQSSRHRGSLAVARCKDAGVRSVSRCR